MKIKNMCSEKNYKSVNALIDKSDFDLSDEAEVIIIDSNDEPINLIGYDNNCMLKLNSNDILLIESYNNNIYAKTKSVSVQIKSKLYEVELLLSQKGFIRVNKSQIINLKTIVRIKPMLNYRIKVHLEDNFIVFVSRKYYHSFIEKFKK